MGNYYDPNDWEYSGHPKKNVLTIRCVRLGAALLKQPQTFRSQKNTLLAHKYIFRQFTPVGFPKYAGNYRGSDYDVLKNYKVKINSDPKVGVAPNLVRRQMALFDDQFENTVLRFEKEFAVVATPEKKVLLTLSLVEIIGTFLVRFLTIHPYANGNGHMARLLVMAMLGRFGILPKTWTIDDRPPYSDAIFAHRRGNTKPLTKVLLECIYGKAFSV